MAHFLKGRFTTPFWIKENEILYAVRENSKAKRYEMSLVLGRMEDLSKSEEIKKLGVRELEKMLTQRGIQLSGFLFIFAFLYFVDSMEKSELLAKLQTSNSLSSS